MEKKITVTVSTVVKVVLWLIPVVFTTAMFVFTQTSVNAKVIKLEEENSITAKLLCSMAIELKLASSIDVCNREVYKK